MALGGPQPLLVPCRPGMMQLRQKFNIRMHVFDVDGNKIFGTWRKKKSRYQNGLPLGVQQTVGTQRYQDRVWAVCDDIRHVEHSWLRFWDKFYRACNRR